VTFKKKVTFKKGMIPWSKGKHLSEEHRKKLSESHKGKIGWNRGLTKETDERIRRIGEGHKGEKNVLFGKHLSEETKRKISKSKKNNQKKTHRKKREEN